MENLIPQQDTRDDNLWYGVLFMVLLLVKLFILTAAFDHRTFADPLPGFSCKPVVILPGSNLLSEPTAARGRPAAWTLGGATGLLEIVCEEDSDQIGNREPDFSIRHERKLSLFWR